MTAKSRPPIYTFDRVIRQNASRYPDKTASIFRDRRVTYGALDLRLNRLVNALQRLGLVPGDRIAVLSRNSHIYIETLLGAAKGGFVLTTLNFMLDPVGLSYILRHSDARVILFQSEFSAVVELIASDCPALEHCIDLDGVTEFAKGYEDLLTASSDEDPKVRVHESDLWLLVYTSGTTGRPKGVMLSHRNICTNVADSASGVGLTISTINLNVCPLYHVAASVFQTLTTFYLGGKSVTLESFDPVAVLEAIARERITYTFFVPTMIFRILELKDAGCHDLSSLKRVGYGAAPMPIDRLKKAIDLFGMTLFQGYGLTESTANIVILSPEDHDLTASGDRLTRLQSCGRGHSGHELRVLDDLGNELPPGEIGEICVRSESVMEGYWKDPDNTCKAIRSGWLHSGDMGYMDQNRYIYIAGRRNDMIKSGGEKIYPQEIEELLFGHPAVLEAAVCGVPHPDWGEVPRAYVALRPGSSLSAEEILAYCASALPGFKCPKDVVFLSELPKTASGKITRAALQVGPLGSAPE